MVQRIAACCNKAKHRLGRIHSLTLLNMRISRIMRVSRIVITTPMIVESNAIGSKYLRWAFGDRRLN